MASVPVLPGQSLVAPAGVTQQYVPVAHWPRGYADRQQYALPWQQAGWVAPQPLPANRLHPRRLLSFFEFPGDLPDAIELDAVQASASEAVAAEAANHSPWSLTPTGRTQITKRTDEHFHHCADLDGALRLKYHRHELTLRAGWRRPNRDAWWQWVNAQQLWAGPVAEAWLIGGHVYAGEKDRFMTMAEAVRPFESELADEQMVMVKMYLVLFANGVVDARLHFINGELYGRGGPVVGKPMLWMEAPSGVHSNPAAEAWHLDTQNMQPFGGHGSEALADCDGGLNWLPFADTKVVLGTHCNPITQELTPFEMVGSEQGFAVGVARTAACQLAFDQAAGPARYLAAPGHYALAAEMMTPTSLAEQGEQRDKPARTAALANEAREVYLRNEMKQGFTAGGTFRYLDNYPDERWEFASDANETASFFRGAYLRQDSQLYELALRNADFCADLCCKHTDFVCRYHAAGESQEIYSLIYMRFGGLIYSHLETGDPYYLETAQAVAGRWLATHRENWPRQNIGRDAEPVEGILLLHDYTGQDYYFDAARQIASDVAASLNPDGSWASGAGVGPFWGTNALEGTLWNGAHLMSGIAEYIARADQQDPQTVALLAGGKRLLSRWLTMLADEDYFHRAGMSYAWRRQWALAWAINDDHLLSELERAFEATLTRFEASPHTFFKNGHHCASYIDAPYYYLANMLCYHSQP